MQFSGGKTLAVVISFAKFRKAFNSVRKHGDEVVRFNLEPWQETSKALAMMDFFKSEGADAIHMQTPSINEMRDYFRNILY